MYHILPYTKARAKRLGVTIIPSVKLGKKIDVFSPDGDYICSIGDIKYSDYPTYIKTHGKEYADFRRYLYKIRHDKDRRNIGSRGWFADYLLW
jgi:hypothetical protein